jgi:hypothetical protein
MVAPSPSAKEHQRRAKGDTGEGGVGHGYRLVGRLAEAHDVEQHVGVVVGGVVHHLLHQQRVDPLEQSRHGER